MLLLLKTRTLSCTGSVLLPRGRGWRGLSETTLLAIAEKRGRRGRDKGVGQVVGALSFQNREREGRIFPNLGVDLKTP